MKRLLLASLCAAMLSPAATLTLSFTDRGWYSSFGTEEAGNDNYATGYFTSNTRGELRSFFLFTLPNFSGPVTAATLRFSHPLYSSADPTETLVLHDVTSSSADLLASTGGLAVFDDLASGIGYGSRDFSSVDNGKIVEISLNGNGIVDINSKLGSTFAIGGSLSTLGDKTASQLINSFSGGAASITELVLTYEENNKVPEPSTLGLTAAALTAALWRRIRR